MTRITLSLTSLAALAVTASVSLAAEPAPPYAGPWPGWHGPWSGFWWVCPLMFLFLVVICVAVFFAFRGRGRHWGPPWRWPGEFPEPRQESERETALDILNKRYARGEIDRQEYSEIKAAIGSDDRPPRQS